MSSILEALRELEEDRGRGTPRKSTSVVDAPREPTRSIGTFIPLTGGLAIGVLVFGLYVWGAGVVGPRQPDPGSVSSETARREDVRAGPAWLEKAEAPRARVTSPPAPAAERLASDDGTRAATPPPPALPKVATRREANGHHQVDVESIRFSPNVDQRAVTLRVNGRQATLRQRESIGEVEVQLIMSDGVYLQRGSEVFFVTPSR